MIVVLNGYPRSGKDEFVSMCRDLMPKGTVIGISTVDGVKKIARMLGWDGSKTPENRRFLSDLKDTLTRWDDLPFKQTLVAAYDAMNEMSEEQLINSIIFVHCREPQEIQKFVDTVAATTLLIRRPSVESNDQSNHADRQVLEYNYDYVIDNDSDLVAFKNKAKLFLEEMGLTLK